MTNPLTAEKEAELRARAKATRAMPSLFAYEALVDALLATLDAARELDRQREAAIEFLTEQLRAARAGLDVERLAKILRDERDCVPRRPANYWTGYRDGLETALRRLETDFALEPDR